MRWKLSLNVPQYLPDILAPLLAGALSLFDTTFAAAVTSTWGSAASGVWNVDANWSSVPLPNLYPDNGHGGAATFDAIISPAGPAYTVTLNTDITVQNLTINSANATLNQTAGIFTAHGAVTLSAGEYQLSGGTISNSVVNVSGTGSLSIAATSSNLLTGVTVNGDLSLSAGGARTKIAGGTTFTTAHMAGVNSEMGFAPGSTLSGTVLFEGGSGGNRFVDMNGTDGTFTVGASGVIRTETGIGGSGVIGSGSNFAGAMTLVNQGLISSQVSGITITINPASFTNSGTFSASNNGILTIAPSGMWTNAGTISVNNATVNLNGTFDTTGGIGTWSNTAGLVNINGTINNAGSTLTLNNSTGSWTLNGGTLSGGTLAFANGQTLLIAASSSNLLTGVTVNGDLSLSAGGARTKIAGGTTFTTAHMAGVNSEMGFAPGSTLSGTVLFEGGSGGNRFVDMNGTDGTFTVGASAVIRTETGDVGNGAIGSGSNFAGAMTLVNQGLISSQVSGITITINPSSFTNSGIVEAINGGSLAVPAGYTQTAGVTRVDGGGTIAALNGATLNNIVIAAGRIEGNGTVTANVANSGTIAPGLSAGQLAINGDLSFTPSSTLQLEIGGVAQGTQYDFLTEAGTLALNLDGTLSVTLIDGFKNLIQPSDFFTVLMSNQAITGAFLNVATGRIATTGGEGSFQVVVSGNTVVLNNFIPEPSSTLLLAAGVATLARRRNCRG